VIGVLRIHLHLPGCSSLKEKRSIIKPLIARLHREFNVSVAEMEAQDSWQQVVIACALVGNDAAYLERSMQNVAKWVKGNWPDGDIIDQQLEIIG
jgi:uncharacterized protein